MKRLFIVFAALMVTVSISAQSLSLRQVVEVAGRQGVACDGEFYYVSGSTALYKYSKSGELQLVNDTPFAALALAANHIGDIDVYDGEIYAGIETFSDGEGKNIQIAVYSASDLSYKRSIRWEPSSGQVEVCGVAVDVEHDRIWMADWVQGTHLYCYSLSSGEYEGRVALRPAPALQQGIVYHNGEIVISCDDGDADKMESDNLYVCSPYLSGSTLPESVEVRPYRAMSDFRRVGEIEGLTFDPSDGSLAVLANRGSRIVLGMPKGFYSGYDREIHEIYIYSAGLEEDAERVFYDAAVFPLFGKAERDDLYLSATSALTVSPMAGSLTPSPLPAGVKTGVTTTRYERLPQRLEGVSRDAVWSLGRNSAGLYIRFRTNSSTVSARWENTNAFLMNHMTMTGIRGLDLYVLEDGRWNFLGSGRPRSTADKYTQAKIIGNMKPEMREYMLYLSLYDGVTSLAVGVEASAELLPPAVVSPSVDSPIVFYGTSILQGGCCTRPGMAFTSIISRRLGRECVNLGFSGNALLDMEIAELMAGVENPALYVFDYVPNATADMIREHGEEFYHVVRDAHPDVPIIFVEDPIFPHSRLDQKMAEEIRGKNVEQKALFERLKKSGAKKIYYLSAEGMTGDDYEETVDGIHFTDVGMMRYADHIMPVIKKALKK